MARTRKTVRISKYNKGDFTHRVRWREEDGKEQARSFKSKSAANDFAATTERRLKKGGKVGGLSDENARELAIAKKRLSKHPDATLLDAVDFYIAYLDRKAETSLISELVEQRDELNVKEDMSQGHILDYRSRWRRFCKDFGERPASTIDADEISEWLSDLMYEEGKAAQTVKNYRRALHKLFNHALARKKVSENPVEHAFNPKVDLPPPGILTLDEVERLMAAVSQDRMIVAGIAIQLFGGVRLEEMHKLTWQDVKVDAGFIHITPRVGKGGIARHVDISPALLSFLELIPVSEREGKISLSPKNRQDRLLKARKAAGLPEWPHNCLRHSFASYHLQISQSAGETALQMGHLSETMLWKNYRAVVTQSDAERFWEIRGH